MGLSAGGQEQCYSEGWGGWFLHNDYIPVQSLFITLQWCLVSNKIFFIEFKRQQMCHSTRGAVKLESEILDKLRQTQT